MLKDSLLQKKSTILEQWFQAIAQTYPLETFHFLVNKKDPFQNPVGHTVSSEIENLFHALFQETERQKIFQSLENILKIRAVQDFTPSQAVIFIFSLKRILWQESLENLVDKRFWEEWMEIESKIDTLLLMAFEVYTQCREKIYEIRIGEIKKQSLAFWEKTKEEGKIHLEKIE